MTPPAASPSSPRTPLTGADAVCLPSAGERGARQINPFDRALAAKAMKLAKKGLKGKAIGEALKVPTERANQLAAVGARHQAIDGAKLTEGELMLILTLASIERERLETGETSSAKSKNIGWRVGKSRGWAASVARKRIGTHLPGETSFYGTGLQFVHASPNGHIWLLPAGWALVHAVEAAAKQVPA